MLRNEIGIKKENELLLGFKYLFLLSAIVYFAFELTKNVNVFQKNNVKMRKIYFSIIVTIVWYAMFAFRLY